MPAPRARTRLDPEVRREQILDAAERVLAAGEPADLTFEQVAESAGVSRGLVYNYFGDRAGLLGAVLLRALEPLAEALEDQLAAVGSEPEQQLHRVIETYLRFAADHPAAWKLLGLAETSEHPDVGRVRLEHLERLGASWGATAESRLVVRALVGFLEAATVEWLLRPELPLDRAAAVLHGQLWSGLSAARAQSGTTVSTARQQYHATTLR